eukprot:gnl/MRDRNA2_/MRDRNA2_29158_c0_seq2.p1 gnl/MRDRNA2_/MRDRNA2_29158_c0~~gnl/MRDRNA2_/MRDRNA2_29158_c0_seq2.p1  ORF type:complete len:311 (+),score=62.72 gnl/MRDRNA2_/MRDRNA2_29158_c0_seq2:126-1058(+)
MIRIMWEDSDVCSNYVNEYWGEYHKIDSFCLLPQDAIRGGSCPDGVSCSVKQREETKKDDKEEDWKPGTHSRSALLMLIIITGLGSPLVCICVGMLVQSIRERRQFAEDDDERCLKDGMEPSADVIGGQYNGFYLRPPPLQGPSATPATVAPMPYVGSLQAGKGFALPRPPPRPPPKLPADFQARVVKGYQKSMPSCIPDIEKPPLRPQPPAEVGEPPPPPGSPLRPLPGFGVPLQAPPQPPKAVAELRIPPRPPPDSGRGAPAPPEIPITPTSPPPPPPGSPGQGGFELGPPAPPGSPPTGHPVFGMLG